RNHAHYDPRTDCRGPSSSERVRNKKDSPKHALNNGIGSLLPLFHPRHVVISRAPGYVIAPTEPEKTGAPQKLRHFRCLCEPRASPALAGECGCPFCRFWVGLRARAIYLSMIDFS